MTEVGYQVKTPDFEGPLGVLLGLIEEHKLEVSRVSLSAVADDFLNYIHNLGVELLNRSSTPKYLAEMVNFLAIAATLVLIKSKSLLPSLELSQEEEEEISALERRLEIFRAVQEVGAEIRATYGRRVIFSRPEGLILPVFSPTPELTSENLLSALNFVLDNLPKQEKLPLVSVQKAITLEDMLKRLVARVETALKFNFHDFAGDSDGGNSKERRVYVIVGFLAMLELVRRGLISTIQQGHLEEIIIEKQNV